MPDVITGPIHVTAYPRTNMGISGPVRARGRVSIITPIGEIGLPALCIATLFKKGSSTPIAFGYDFTDPVGEYDAYISTQGKNLEPGDYYIKEIVFSAIFPIPTNIEVPVVLDPDVVSLGLLTATVRSGSARANAYVFNLGNTTWRGWVGALVAMSAQEEVAAERALISAKPNPLVLRLNPSSPVSIPEWVAVPRLQSIAIIPAMTMLGPGLYELDGQVVVDLYGWSEFDGQVAIDPWDLGYTGAPELRFPPTAPVPSTIDFYRSLLSIALASYPGADERARQDARFTALELAIDSASPKVKGWIAKIRRVVSGYEDSALDGTYSGYIVLAPGYDSSLTPPVASGDLRLHITPAVFTKISLLIAPPPGHPVSPEEMPISSAAVLGVTWYVEEPVVTGTTKVVTRPGDIPWDWELDPVELAKGNVYWRPPKDAVSPISSVLGDKINTTVGATAAQYIAIGIPDEGKLEQALNTMAGVVNTSRAELPPGALQVPSGTPDVGLLFESWDDSFQSPKVVVPAIVDPSTGIPIDDMLLMAADMGSSLSVPVSVVSLLFRPDGIDLGSAPASKIDALSLATNLNSPVVPPEFTHLTVPWDELPQPPQDDLVSLQSSIKAVSTLPQPTSGETVDQFKQRLGERFNLKKWATKVLFQKTLPSLRPWFNTQPLWRYFEP